MNKFTGLEVKDREIPQHFLKIFVNSNSLWLKTMQPAAQALSSGKIYALSKIQEMTTKKEKNA